MHGMKISLAWVSVTALALAGCAVSPEQLARQQEIDADIDSILSAPLDPAVYGEPQRCLSENEIRNFEALDDRRIVFEGRHGRLWLNTLRGPCPDLEWAHALRVRSISFTRICDMDRFQPSDWFYWPWYRRWPWSHESDWGMGPSCLLGNFQPVTAEQVEEIKAVLRSR